jgi:hypothetical protein
MGRIEPMREPMREAEKKKGAARTRAAEPIDAESPDAVQHERATTTQPFPSVLEGGQPAPDELTGRASTTSESLTELFRNGTAEHLADGFRGGSGDDPDSDVARDDQGLQLQAESASDLEEAEESDEVEPRS